MSTLTAKISEMTAQAADSYNSSRAEIQTWISRGASLQGELVETVKTINSLTKSLHQVTEADHPEKSHPHSDPPKWRAPSQFNSPKSTESSKQKNHTISFTLSDVKYSLHGMSPPLSLKILSKGNPGEKDKRILKAMVNMDPYI